MLAGLLSQHRPCCCIVPDEYQVSIFEQDIHLFTSQPVIPYPAYEIPPYTPLSPDGRTTATRISALYRMFTEQQPAVLITSVEAMMRRLLPVATLANQAELLLKGEETNPEQLRENLVRLGYESVALVQTVGDFSVRGGIFDIFPPPFVLNEQLLVDGPIRLDFFGDTIESIRSFEPISQRSTGELTEAIILPVHDVVIDRNPNQGKRLARLFKEAGREAQWDEDETELLADRIASGRKFAGMEFFLPFFYP